MIRPTFIRGGTNLSGYKGVCPCDMVQNQVAVLGCNRPNGAFRQARPLAEGQKSADVKHDFTKTTPLRQLRQLAEGVEFPEKCRFWCLRAVIWRRGFSSRKCHPIDAILNHAVV